MTLLVPASSLIKRNRPAAMPTTSSVLAVVSKIWVMQSAVAVFLCVCVCFCFFFVETIFCKTVCFYFCRAETSLHCTDWQLNPSCFYSSVLKHRWSITGTECTPTSGPLGFISRLSFNVRALSCALVSPRGGKMKKPPNLTSSISSKR